MKTIDFGHDTPPIDTHPVDTEETFDAARKRIDLDAADAVEEVRGRLGLAMAAAERQGWHPAAGGAMPAPHSVDWAAWRAQRLRVELAAIEVWRNRRVAEWVLAHHARWAGVRERDALQRVVARAYSEVGAFYDPARDGFSGVDVHDAVARVIASLGAGLGWVSRPAALVH